MFFSKLSARSFPEHPGSGQHLPVFTLAVEVSQRLDHQEPDCGHKPGGRRKNSFLLSRPRTQQKSSQVKRRGGRFVQRTFLPEDEEVAA